MKVSNNRSAKKARDMLQAIVVDKDNTFIDSEFNDNCVVSNNVGVSLGAESFKSLYMKFHESINLIDYKLIAETITPATITYEYILRGRHIGVFDGIPPTGKLIQFKSTSITTMEDNKISTVSASSDTDSIIVQLTGRVKQYDSSKLRTPDISKFSVNTFKLTIFHLESKGIKLTGRQLQCLCLSTTGLTDIEIANILNLSCKTVNAHQEKVRLSFKCKRKQHVFDILENLKMRTMIKQCLMFIIPKK